MLWLLRKMKNNMSDYSYCSYSYRLPELIFPLLTFRDKGERVLAGSLLRSKILRYALNFQWIQNSIFPNWKHIFDNSLINFWNLRKWNISFIMLSLKCGQPCVNPPSYFQQWNLNCVITFPNSSIDSKLRLWNLGLRQCFQVFLSSKTQFAEGYKVPTETTQYHLRTNSHLKWHYLSPSKILSSV